MYVAMYVRMYVYRIDDVKIANFNAVINLKFVIQYMH